MKKTLLSFVVALLAATGVSAQDIDWTWGIAKWNIEDGTTFDGIDDYEEKGGVTLTFPNITGAYLTMFNSIGVSCNIYVDDATDHIEAHISGSGNGDLDIEAKIGYRFAEGHTYRIVTTGAVLIQANPFTTRTTDTLSISDDSYNISFTITGPELVKTINVESNQALSIIDENGAVVDSAIVTYSLVDTVAIKTALGIKTLEEATLYGLDANGSYVGYEWFGPGYFDGWRDGDGDYTIGYGSDSFHGGNSSLSSYRIQLNETCDSVFYSFNESWKEYDPDDPDTVPGSGIDDVSVKARAAGTIPPMNTVLWDKTNAEGTTITYSRKYRVDEGCDYKARFVFIANQKYVLLNATLHFLSQEDYVTGINAAPANAPVAEGIYSLSGVRLNSLQKGINIVKSADGSTRKVLVK